MFTEYEKEKILEVVVEYRKFQHMSKTLKDEIDVNKANVAELIEKLKNGEATDDAQTIIADINSTHEQHTQMLSNIIEEMEIVKARETAMYQELATKYDVEVNTIISEAVNTILKV